MIPIRFGTPNAALYGVFHAADRRPAAPRAVLMCNPFGQEAVRIHRFFRVLAERLAREGIASLRFDYHATGESLGEDDEGDIERWRRDILSAHELLRQRAQTTDISWLAPRLGAALAAHASTSALPGVRQLLLWQPVVQGSAYLDELRRAHEQTLRSLPASAHSSPFESEVIGFGISPTLLKQIGGIAPSVYDTVRAERVVLLGNQGDAALPALAKSLQALNMPTEQHLLDIRFDWTSEEALNSALVPAPALNRLLQLIGGASHE